MTKQKQLARKTVNNAGAMCVVIAVMGGAYYGTQYYADRVAGFKADTDNALNADTARIASYTSQIDKSGDAQVRYGEITRTRDPANTEFGTDLNTYKLWLKAARDQYRFTGLKLNPSDEKPTDKSELQTFNYSITIYPGMSMSFDAMSDLHVLSFLESMQGGAPGIFNMTHVKMTRAKDLDQPAVSAMQNGATPANVNAQMDFDWIGIVPKKDEKTDKAEKADKAKPPVEP